MGKKIIIAALIITELLIFSVAMLPQVLADTWLPSGTIQLVQEAYLQYFVQLQKGDRFEGNFTVTNLTPYSPSTNLPPWVNQSSIQTFGVEIFAFAEIGKGQKNPQIFYFANDYLNPSEESQYFFNYTAEYSAFYFVDFYCSTNIFGPNIEIPKVTVDYDVIEATPFKLHILSPQNQTYGESIIPLSIATDREVNRLSYSLDGKDNATFNGNITLIGLSEGMHHITVYAVDSNGYANAPAVIFTVLTTSEAPTLTQTPTTTPSSSPTQQPTLEASSTPNLPQQNPTSVAVIVGAVVAIVLVVGLVVYSVGRRRLK